MWWPGEALTVVGALDGGGGSLGVNVEFHQRFFFRKSKSILERILEKSKSVLEKVRVF